MQTKSAPPPPPAVIYAAKLTEDDRGIPDQLARARAMATERGWRVAGEFTDEGFSAYWRNRGPGLERAKAAAIELTAHHGECLLVALHSDRIARGAGDAPGAASRGAA